MSVPFSEAIQKEAASVWCLEELGVQEIDFYIVPGEEFCQNSFMGYVLICIWGFLVPLLVMVNFVPILNIFSVLWPVGSISHCILLGFSATV